MDKPKVLLFSLTRDDFEWDYFRSGGKGGQNQNKVNSGARCTHPPSGAVGEARDSRSQLQNRRSAFVRCVQSTTFKAWHSKECARLLSTKARTNTDDRERLSANVREAVERQMGPENIKIDEF